MGVRAVSCHNAILGFSGEKLFKFISGSSFLVLVANFSYDVCTWKLKLYYSCANLK